MKKLTAMILALVMVLALAAGAFAAGRLTKDEAKQIALKEAGVTAAEATFTKMTAGKSMNLSSLPTARSSI